MKRSLGRNLGYYRDVAGDPIDVTTTAERDEEPARLFAFWPGGAASAELPRAGQELTIGRDPSSGLCIAHASVSRAHAVVRGDKSPTIRDLGSHNGTMVGGQRIQAAVPLAKNEIVRIGSASLIVQGGESVVDDEAVPSSDGTLDAAMRELLRLLDVVAKSDISVVLVGETGVGKEVLASRVHAMSRRAKGPFVRINCAALSESLLETELFGHERGAFTGALAAKAGLFEAASRGTIFLDEVGEISATVQVKLLRVLESREVTRVGALKPVAVDARVVAATHRDLTQLVEKGAFREDLYFRLNGITVAIPPLRERKSEILPLAEQFVREASARAGRSSMTIAPGARELLVAYEWPGNVRELKATMERSVVLCEGDVLDREQLALSSPRASPSRPRVETAPLAGSTLPDALSALERQSIDDALRACGGNQTAAAKMLGISRRTLVYRLSALGATRPRKP